MLTCDEVHSYTFISSNTQSHFPSDIPITFLMKAHAQVKNMQMRGAPGRPSLAINVSENTKFQVPKTEILP